MKKYLFILGFFSILPLSLAYDITPPKQQCIKIDPSLVYRNSVVETVNPFPYEYNMYWDVYDSAGVFLDDHAAPHSTSTSPCSSLGLDSSDGCEFYFGQVGIYNTYSSYDDIIICIYKGGSASLNISSLYLASSVSTYFQYTGDWCEYSGVGEMTCFQSASCETDFTLCLSQEDCEASSWFWNPYANNFAGECLEYNPCADTFEACYNQDDCEYYNYYWNPLQLGGVCQETPVCDVNNPDCLTLTEYKWGHTIPSWTWLPSDQETYLRAGTQIINQNFDSVYSYHINDGVTSIDFADTSISGGIYRPVNPTEPISISSFSYGLQYVKYYWNWSTDVFYYPPKKYNFYMSCQSSNYVFPQDIIDVSNWEYRELVVENCEPYYDTSTTQDCHVYSAKQQAFLLECTNITDVVAFVVSPIEYNNNNHIAQNQLYIAFKLGENDYIGDIIHTNPVTGQPWSDSDVICPFDNSLLCDGFDLINTGLKSVYHSSINMLELVLNPWLFFIDNPVPSNNVTQCASFGSGSNISEFCAPVSYQENIGVFDYIIYFWLLWVIFNIIVSFYLPTDSNPK